MAMRCAERKAVAISESGVSWADIGMGRVSTKHSRPKLQEEDASPHRLFDLLKNPPIALGQSSRGRLKGFVLRSR
jgi:hypothetical protein